MMTGLAGAIDIQHRRLDVVIRDLGGADPLIWHVAIGARNTRSCVDALIPYLELGVLSFQRRRAVFFVGPIGVGILDIIL